MQHQNAMRSSLIPRFTIRDLLWLTTFVAISLAGFANSRQVAAMSRWLNDAVAKEAVKVGPLLMGRESVEPEY